MNTPKSPHKFVMHFSRYVSDLDWRLLLFIIPPLSFLVFLSISSMATTNFTTSTSFFIVGPFQSLFHNSAPGQSNSSSSRWVSGVGESEEKPWLGERKEQLDRSRIAVCLVGGARRFELTGPSIVENILQVYPNSDLFLDSPLDSNAYKLSLLKSAPRIASVCIFKPKDIPETESQLRVLTARDSPNGIQGLLQYFTLVEGCLSMITTYQLEKNFSYDWIIRTRVDSYWSHPLRPDNFVRGKYLVPPGSSYGGLNDRLGIGDLHTSTIALSRVSLVPQLDLAGFRQLNSESAFKAQLTTQNVSYVTRRLPFCIMTDRKYDFPPPRFGVPVVALSSRGPLSGAKCRPCSPVCSGPCVGKVMNGLAREWSWTDWANRTLELCDAHDEWERGWEKIFDRVAGKTMASARKRVLRLNPARCVHDIEEMRRRSAHWEAPPSSEICRLGLASA